MKNLIQEIRYKLNDVEKLAYSDDLLVRFVNGALCLISELRPERFAKSHIMKAKRGAIQCVGGCCANLLSVDDVVDKHGNPINYLKKGDVDMDKAFNKSSTNGFKVGYTFNLSSQSENTFVVHPPIKATDEVYFLVTCVEKPQAMNIDDTFKNCSMRELIIHYVMYSAYSVETESQTSVALADRHIKLFYDILGLERKVDKENDKQK